MPDDICCATHTFYGATLHDDRHQALPLTRHPDSVAIDAPPEWQPRVGPVGVSAALCGRLSDELYVRRTPCVEDADGWDRLAATFERLGVLVFPNFLGEQQCEQLRAAMQAACSTTYCPTSTRPPLHMLLRPC